MTGRSGVRNCTAGLLPGVVLAGALLAAAAMPVRAVTVSVAPADTLVTLGDSFLIRVEADAFADLKGYQLIFQFDPAVIALTGALPGEVLTGPGAWFGTLLPDAAAPPDSAWYDAAKLDGSTATPGVLVYFQFQAVQEGESLIECRYVDFRDSANAQTLPGCTGGRVIVVGPVSVRAATWGRVKGLYR